MKIENSTIDKLAKLSSLNIANDKKETLAKELEEIVQFVENLNEIDVSGVEATLLQLRVDNLCVKILILKKMV